MSQNNRQQAQGPRTSELIRRTAVITLTVIGIVGLAFFFVAIKEILVWILIGFVLAIALAPSVAWLQRRGLRRVPAALLILLAVVAIITGAVLAVAIPVLTQTSEFVLNLPEIVRSVFSPGGELHFLEVRFGVLERLARITPAQVAQILVGNQTTILNAVSRVASVVVAIVGILTITVMLLIEGPKAWKAILSSLSGKERDWAVRIGNNFLRSTGGYVNGTLALSLVAGVTSYVMLRILSVPYPETLAVLVAILDIIPLVGATIAALIVVLIGLSTGGITDGVVLLVFFITYQLLENNVLQNLVYAKTVALSPLVVFIAALVGASLAGLVGVLLAIPLASAFWSLGRDYLALRRERQSEEPPPKAGGEPKAAQGPGA